MKPLKPWGFTPEEWIPAEVAAAQATLGAGGAVGPLRITSSTC